jgi:NADPH:quinone reductase-like Zn-dependent oxidoreductase
MSGFFVGSRRMLEDLSRFVSAKGIHPVVDRRFPLVQAAGAYEHLKRADHFGKLVIEMG